MAIQKLVNELKNLGTGLLLIAVVGGSGGAVMLLITHYPGYFGAVVGLGIAWIAGGVIREPWK